MRVLLTLGRGLSPSLRRSNGLMRCAVPVLMVVAALGLAACTAGSDDRVPAPETATAASVSPTVTQVPPAAPVREGTPTATPAAPTAPTPARSPPVREATPSATPPPWTVATSTPEPSPPTGRGAAPTATPAAPTPAPSPVPGHVGAPAGTPAPTPGPVRPPPPSPTFDTPPGSYTAIAVGAHHACALTESGEAVCWDVESGERWEAPPGRYTDVAVDDDATCAASTAGEIECWLRPGSGWVLPEEAPAGTYVAVAVAEASACALTEARGVVCWGFGDAVPDGRYTFPPGEYATIDLGYLFADESGNQAVYLTACARTVEGDLVCWRGRISDDRVERAVERTPGSYAAAHVYLLTVCTLTAEGDPACGEWGGDGSTRYTAMAVGHEFVCAIAESGQAHCTTHAILGVVWGRFGARWLMTPPPAGPGRRYVALDVGGGAGGGNACALTDLGEAVCWGSVQNTVPRPDPPAGGYIAVSDGSGHTCALTAGSEAVCWGWNNLGQVDVPEGRYTAISAGYASTCALTEAGGAVCWGARRHALPEGRYRAISAGYRAVCGLTDDGEAVCSTPYPVPDAPSGPFTEITLAWTGDACALRVNGEAVCWGPRRELGWLDVPEGRWTAIDAGDNHACAIGIAGEVVCWGDPSLEIRAAPPAGRYTALGTSGYDLCLLSDAGQVSCWSVDDWPNGARRSLEPSDGARAVEVSVGLGRACVRTETGLVECWETQYEDVPWLNRHGYQAR